MLPIQHHLQVQHTHVRQVSMTMTTIQVLLVNHVLQLQIVFTQYTVQMQVILSAQVVLLECILFIQYLIIVKFAHLYLVVVEMQIVPLPLILGVILALLVTTKRLGHLEMKQLVILILAPLVLLLLIARLLLHALLHLTLNVQAVLMELTLLMMELTTHVLFVHKLQCVLLKSIVLHPLTLFVPLVLLAITVFRVHQTLVQSVLLYLVVVEVSLVHQLQNLVVLLVQLANIKLLDQLELLILVQTVLLLQIAHLL